MKMGAHQSTRRITINNEEVGNVISVSESVVNRLTGFTEGSRSRSDRGPHVPPPTLPVHPAGVPVGPHVTPMYPQYMYEPSQTSLQLRQEKEASLRKNDQYWQNRINELEKQNEKINQLMDEEYQKAVMDVKGHFAEAPKASRTLVCQDIKKKVMQCYKQHPTEPMRCAKEVQEFAECVDKHRFSIVANLG